MAWILGIDEAGYGPNLGPFVMSAVACRVSDGLLGSCLWQALNTAVRRADGRKKDDRLLVDDSKVVYSSGKGLAGLERGVFSLLDSPLPTLDELLRHLCADDHDEMTREVWYNGRTSLPADTDPVDLKQLRDLLSGACSTAGVTQWLAYSTVVCPSRFNTLVDRAGSKGAVLAHAFSHLLHRGFPPLEGTEPLAVFVDKQGGRNTYAPQIQHALERGFVVAVEESMMKSAYQVRGLDREVRLTFQPRADREHFCVALASMVSKYVRELCMGEFNAFWQQHVPGLKATAGYPGDAARFFEAIRPIAETMNIPEGAIWRRK
jgi:hypothetical protein